MLAATPSQVRVVPLALPAGFFLLASLALAWGAGLLALNPEALSAYRHPVVLAASHLLLLGFGVGVLVGSMHQLVPVVVEAPLYRPGLGYGVMLLWGAGVPLEAAGFLAGRPEWVAVGGGLVLLALFTFGVQMGCTFLSAPRWNRVATALAWVTGYLVLTPVLGLVQALALRYGFYDPERLVWHVLAGLGGIFLLAILGVGHKLVAMFTLAHGVGEEVLGLVLWTVNLGLLGLALGERTGGVLLAVGVGLGGVDLWRILKRRTRRALDIGVRHYVAGMGFLVLSLGALAAGNVLVAGTWFVLGFVGLVTTGMLYKILPFLIWTHRYAPRVGREPVPLLKEMLPERAAYLAGGLFALGALLAPGWPPALWLFALGTLPYAYTLWEVVRR